MSVRLRPRELALFGLALALAAVCAFLVVHGTGKAALAVLLLPAAALILVIRPGRAFPAAVILILVLPYWWSLGSGQATVIRVAVCLAVFSVLSARNVRPTATDYALAAYII